MTHLLATIAAIVALGVAVFGLPASAAAAEVRPGAPAPGFSAQSIAGKTVRLGDFAGKTVVLEWTNNGCPFVRKHYDGGNMQALQRRHAAAGGVWLIVASSAPGEQGHVSPDEARNDLKRWSAGPSDFLLDPDGVVGRLYDARATPQMAVIDPTGKLAYIGAIDDKPSSDPRDIPAAKNYVTAALDDLAAGKPVAIAATRVYGCSIKYKGS